tara:strand:+ start:1558 stop:2016 length:459 start_codon:yes stop_codon:yes gene_type:complete
MEIILVENISKLGKIGDKVEVKNGYARNYLLPQGKALRLNKENLDYVNKKKDELNKKNNAQKKEFKIIAEKVNNKTLTFFKESKENGDLYGSIKPKEISLAFEKDLKVNNVKPSNIILKKDINKIGSYTIDINLFAEVSAKVKLIVKKTETK